MKVIFMGTPDFAAPALTALINSSHEVVAVFTQRPKPKNRGMQIEQSPIHKLAEINNIPVFTPNTLKTPENQQVIFDTEADIIVVTAYGFIIPKSILEAKKFGCLNIHPSMLPRFRGAAPLQRTIIEGDTESAVCIMQMDEGLDTGDIILSEKFALKEGITLTELHNHCANLGAKLLLKTLDNITILPRIPQTEEGVVYAHKLTKEEGKLDWNKPATVLDCQIRGMNPWPGTYFHHNELLVKVLSACKKDINHITVPGTVLDKDFSVACSEGILQLLQVQPAGKNPQSGAEFLRGYPQVSVGSVLQSINR